MYLNPHSHSHLSIYMSIHLPSSYTFPSSTWSSASSNRRVCILFSCYIFRSFDDDPYLVSITVLGSIYIPRPVRFSSFVSRLIQRERRTGCCFHGPICASLQSIIMLCHCNMVLDHGLQDTNACPQQAPSYRLRIIADFPKLIEFLFDEKVP